MIFTLTHTVSYDTKDDELRREYFEWIDDHEITFEGFKEFLIDRFIHPNFDKGNTVVTVSQNFLEHLRCCDTSVTEFAGLETICDNCEDRLEAYLWDNAMEAHLEDMRGGI